jgi:hypothetical protein
VNTFIRMCGINVPGHTCDEFSVLVAKPSMTELKSRLVSFLRKEAAKEVDEKEATEKECGLLLE